MSSQESINNKFEKVKGGIFKILIEKYKYFRNKFYHIIDGIINSSNYKYTVSFILTLVFILLVVLINLINIPDKYIQIITLFFGGILFSIFYFFVYRNEQEDDKGFAVKGSETLDYIQNERYNKEGKKIVININESEDPGEEKYIFNKENFIKSVYNPIKNLIKFFGLFIFSILAIVTLIVFFYTLYNKFEYLYFFTKIFLGITLVIVILSIIAKLFSIVVKDCEDSPNSVKRFFCIIKNLIFFIPCLLVIIVDEINKDIKATPSSVYLLFILLIIIVSLFIGLPILFEFISSINKHDLLNGKGPYYLDTKRVIGKYQDFSKEYKYIRNNIITPGSKYTLFEEDSNQEFNIKALFDYLGNKKFDYKYTYSITFYLYLNPQPKNTSLAYNKESELFNYGNKPVILYDGNKRKLLIKSKTKTSEGSQRDTIYETKNIKYQKWMLFTINYQNNMIDVFIDGKLVGSKKNVPPYFNDDIISIGEDNGIHGSIKDLYYYETPRPPSNIEFLYDLTIKPTEGEVNFVGNRLNDKLQKIEK